MINNVAAVQSGLQQIAAVTRRSLQMQLTARLRPRRVVLRQHEPHRYFETYFSC